MQPLACSCLNQRLCLQLDQASLGLSREYLNRGFKDKLVQAYYEYMVDIASLLGADRARAEVELKDSLQFEIKLANVSCNIFWSKSRSRGMQV